MKTKKNKERWITPKEIEEILQLSHGTVNKLIHSGAFTTIQIGKSIRIKEDDFLNFMETYKNNKYNM